MERIAALEKEINKGISVDEKSGVSITGWSPNNVRRLFIGSDKAIIQYFMTGGKYNRLYEVVSLNHDFATLQEQLVREPNKFRSILSVLVKGRVCSSVEEIFFCSPGYHPEVLRRDMSMGLLSSSREKAEGRFVRLRHISKVDISVDQLWAINQVDENAKRGTQLYLDAVKLQGVRVESAYEAHKDAWWKQTSLRPRFYPFEVKLGEYFDKVREKKEQLEKYDMERTRQLERFKKAYDNVFPVSRWVIKTTNELQGKMDKLTSSLGLLDRVEWALHMQPDYVFKYMRKHFEETQPEFYKDLRGIDFKVLRSLAMESDKEGITQTADADVHLSERLISMLLSNSAGSSDAYVQGSHKLEEYEALKTIKIFYGKAFRFLLHILYMSFASKLSRNSLKFADYELSLSPNKEELAQLTYTRTITEFANRYLPPNTASECFGVAGFTLVTEEEFSISSATQSMYVLLEAMGGEKVKEG